MYNSLLQSEILKNSHFFKNSICENKNFIALLLGNEVIGFQVKKIHDDGTIGGILLVGGGIESTFYRPHFATMSFKLANSIVGIYSGVDKEPKQEIN